MMQLCTTSLILLMIFSCPADADPSSNDDSPIIQTSNGPIQGLKIKSVWTDEEYYSFRGIPYAAPPIANLRFKGPVPPEKWSSVKDCTVDRPSCPQKISPLTLQMNISANTSEDCLYVNVYIPQIKPTGELLPVMVWVHGGGFFEGSGSYFRYGPDFLVGEGVIVVTLNYRLGALGFMSMEMAEAPGNAGLKDQMFALKWVQREIQHFGGNAANVTLFGESAGSASVHLHYLSPLSKGLFHRVIGESGTALVPWAVRDNTQQYGLLLAKALNCSAEDPLSALKCLREVDAEDIVQAQSLVTPSDEDVMSGRLLIFVPTIDGHSSDEPFLPEEPIRLVEKKQGSHVPFMMGINSDEGMMGLGVSEEEMKNTTNHLEVFILPEVRNSSTKSRLKQLTERIRRFYFRDTIPSFTNLRGYIDLYTDVMFGYSTAVSARYFRDRAAVYLYYFSFNGTFKEPIVQYLEKRFNFSGVSHAEELSYIFVRYKVNQTSAKGSGEMKTWRRMVRMWTNFAKYGVPTVGEDPELQNVTWSPIGKVTTKYLHIDTNLTMVVKDFLGPSVALWDSITPSRSSYLHATGLVIVTSAILYLCKYRVN